MRSSLPATEATRFEVVSFAIFFVVMIVFRVICERIELARETNWSPVPLPTNWQFSLGDAITFDQLGTVHSKRQCLLSRSPFRTTGADLG